MGGKDKNPVKAPKKKMQAAFPVTSNLSAVQDMPL